MAGYRQENLLSVGSFYVKGIRQRVTLTTTEITWEIDTSPNLSTIVPLGEVIACVPCDCSMHGKQWRCQYCLQFEQQQQQQQHPPTPQHPTEYNRKAQSKRLPHQRASLTELLPLQAQAFRLYYAVRSGKHNWRLATAVFHPAEEGIGARQWLCLVRESLKGLKRPKCLLIFVNPYGGKKKAPKLYRKRVAPLFRLAGIETEVIVTERANHARDMLQDMPLEKYDGVISVGGDGMFSELLNSILVRTQRENGINANSASSNLVRPSIMLGVLPAGSTDAVAYCSTGCNDLITSTLLVIMGDSIGIDISSIHYRNSLLRYATSCLSYGYLGDVLIESEKYRWMGPARYKWAGMKTFLRQKTYQGEITMEVVNPGTVPFEQDRCTVGCTVCAKARARLKTENKEIPNTKWMTVKGEFRGLSLATMSCRCGMSKEGVSPTAHLGDGCGDLVIVKKCSAFQYLRYLIRTAIHNQSPFELPFVDFFRIQQYKFNPYTSETNAASPTKYRDDHQRISTSTWNCDGEIVTEPAIHVKVHCQLVRVFARGIEDRDDGESCYCDWHCDSKQT